MIVGIPPDDNIVWVEEVDARPDFLLYHNCILYGCQLECNLYCSISRFLAEL